MRVTAKTKVTFAVPAYTPTIAQIVDHVRAQHGAEGLATLALGALQSFGDDDDALQILKKKIAKLE